VRIRTERLWLRPFAAADADRLDALFALPEVRRFLLDERVMPRSWVEEPRRPFVSDGDPLEIHRVPSSGPGG